MKFPALLILALLGLLPQEKPVTHTYHAARNYLEMGAGWLQSTRLTYFMPYEYDAIGREMQDSGKMGKAAPVFERASRQFPDNLAFYLCYIQPSKEVWVSERKRLEALLAREPENTPCKARLGAVCYYLWFVASEAHFEAANAVRLEDDKLFEKALTLVKSSWEQSHDPVCGVFLVELYLRGRYLPNEANKIKEELIRQVGGERVYAYYTQAKQRKWILPPPPIDWVPKDKQRALMGVVGLDRVKFGIVVSKVLKGGQGKIEWAPRPPEQERAFQYFDKWYQDLKAHEPKI